MEEINLSGREILHIVGIMGKNDFFGIEDAFFGMDDAEVRNAISETENMLLQKGYAQLDFDGNFSVEAEIVKMLSLCVECEKYLDVQILHADKSRTRRLAYQKGGVTVELKEHDRNRYTLFYSEISSLKEEIFESLEWINPKSSVSGRFFFAQTLLSGVKANAGFGAQDDLDKECKDRSAVKVIENGLKGMSNYYSLILFDFTKQSAEIDSLIILNSSDGSLEMQSGNGEHSGEISFRPIKYEAVKERIEETLLKLMRDNDAAS